MKIVVTGANGFVGRPLCVSLAEAGHDIIAAVRSHALLPEGIERRSVAGLSAATDWRAALTGAEAVIHLAARVHVMTESSVDPLADFRAANVAGTLALAEQSVAAGVRHLVFLSSIKANGEETEKTPFGPETAAPVDPYGISKYEAEVGLAALAARTGLAVTVLRPPLVHGPGVKGNLRRLIGAIDRGLPLPLGRVDNRRALIGLGNLTDAIARAVARPPAPGGFRIYTLCDGETVSTPDLIRRLAAALNRPARLVPVPVGWLRRVGRMTGRSAAIQRLTGSLEIDDRLIRAELDWTPPVSLESGLAALAESWRRDHP
ncbi:NAD-dependent epimerase/dehydratase family protein [Magnetospirillum molischianum]|uniref:Nucleoside-diphosphate-sugar epimerase n=1 Tax=Magnetospirillum molischianum DSM 120 TaxID=1150626 RepID=H8FTL7_MAGML|nr:NAD-dependent epimerase/dehydratase family protein [Magnetospirillum molischianum]CCG41705.1 Nucleoside-diphosphate-sugar epimerase [Magnetospirillum molischianum DSM 120]